MGTTPIKAEENHTMKVVFLEDVEGTAHAGEVKDVKNGFARNFLLPRGLAAPAVEPYLRRGEAVAKREAKRQEGLDQEATSVAKRIEGSHIVIPARVGEQGKLFGSVTAVHIAQEVAKLTGDGEFDHRKVLLPEAIKEVGSQTIRLRLTRNVEASVEVEVISEGEEEPPVAELTEQQEAAAEATAEVGTQEVAESASEPDESHAVEAEEAE
jgi:large subunit ribosomal protein L9